MYAEEDSIVTVWKYTLPIGDDLNKLAVGVNIMMPMGAEMLYVKPQQIKGGWQIVVYAHVEPTAKFILRSFFIMGTGHDGRIMRNRVVKSLGAADINDGQKMWHVFYMPLGHMTELQLFEQKVHDDKQ